MLRSFAYALALFSLTAVAQAQEEPTAEQGLTWRDIFDSQSSLTLYGFLRSDAQYDTNRFNDPQTPAYVRSPESDANNKQSEFTLHSRLTRLGLKLNAGRIQGLGNPEMNGRLEIDFFNSGLNDSDSRSAIRMRLAYLNLEWNQWSLLAGQNWDVISPLYPIVNNDMMMWGAGNTGDRRPQLTARHALPMDGGSELVTQFGVALSGAIGGSQVDGGLRSGEASGQPMLNARIGYHGETEQGPYQFGVWAHASRERFDATAAGGSAGEQDFRSNSIGIDVKAPLGDSGFGLAGEYFTGRNLRDIRGGILQGVNGNGLSGEEIDAKGGWLEANYALNETLTLYAGYSYDNPKNGDLSAGDRSLNSIPYLAARWRFSDLRSGFEYLSWSTDYIGLEEGQSQRIVFWLAYYF